MRTALATVALLLAAQAHADEEVWQTVLTGPVTVKNRAVPGTALKEVLAEGDLNAALEDVQDALLTTSKLNTFMPYLKSSRELSERDAENSKYIHTLIDLPVVGKRDYVVRVWVMEQRSNGRGAFRQRWEAAPTYLPESDSVRRITTNNGSWLITATDDTHCHAVYRFMVDPGGWVPTFAVNLGNQKGVVPTFAAIETEANKRRSERLATVAPAPGASQAAP